MAASIRLCSNVRHPVYKLFVTRNCLSACQSRNRCDCKQSRSFSHDGNQRSKRDDHGEENEDFFGIPQDFKLQHARHNNVSGAVHKTHEFQSSETSRSDKESSSVLQQASSLTSGLKHSIEAVDDNETNSVNVEPRLQFERDMSQRERQRLNHPAEFKTSFGSITFDRSLIESTNMTVEDLANKVKEIIEGDSNFSGSHVRAQSVNRKDTVLQGGTGSRSSRSSGQKDNNEARNKATFKKSNVNDEPPNLFDEFYFPELSKADADNSRSDLPFQNNMQDSDLYNGVHSESTNVQLRRNKTNYDDKSYTEDATSIKSSQSKTLHSLPHEKQCKVTENFDNLFDEQYFSSLSKSGNSSHAHSREEKSQSNSKESHLFVEKQSFDTSQRGSHSEQANASLNTKPVEQFNEIDEQYFGESYQDLSQQSDNCARAKTVRTSGDQHSFDKVIRQYTDHPEMSTFTLDPQSSDCDDGKSENLMKKIPNLSDISLEEQEDSDADSDTNWVRPNLDKPKTAYDLAMKIRQDIKYGRETVDKSILHEPKSSALSLTEEQEKDEESSAVGRKLDSKGFRVLDNQVPSLDNMTSADIVRMLRSRIIFNHDDFLAIDKPYGLPSFSQQRDRLSVTEVLPKLAELLSRGHNISDLHLVQGLDRDVTGTIILAKNPETAYILRAMYNNSNEVIQRYWVITKGVPNPPAGIIDIPVGEAKVGNIYKMVLRPRFHKEEKLLGKASKAPSNRAVTEYKVLKSHLQSALVECKLLTNNVQHQIRVHLASGLSTPVLGDHKYSNFSKLAPQKLHTEMLELLKVRQAKVRHIALHLHCRSIVLTNYKGRMIFLTTRPPSHFKENMNSLKLYMPK